MQRALPFTFLAAVAMAASASAQNRQPIFSIDWKSPGLRVERFTPAAANRKTSRVE